MLKLSLVGSFTITFRQPPSGGCVLKLIGREFNHGEMDAAAFGRLCVETLMIDGLITLDCAAAFGRLCVETLYRKLKNEDAYGSRLRAAVC